jgi:homoserine O-acetyltransferase
VIGEKPRARRTDAKPWNDVGSAGVVPACSLTLEEVAITGGRTLGPVTVAYETYGTLDPDGANAILMCHALSGDAHVAGWRESDALANGWTPELGRAWTPPEGSGMRPGWWDQMVGPGKTFDTDKFFVVCSNVLGGCSGTTGPASTNPATGEPYGLSFPVITIEDMVEVQARLLTELGVGRLAAVVGGSMGGMQALAWAKRYPERLGAVAAIATTPRLGAQAIGFDAVGRAAILGDPAFAGGSYYDKPEQPDHGLGLARMIGHITYLSDASMRGKFGRRLREREKYAFDFSHEFEVETYLAYQGQRFVERFDADTYLFLTKAMDYFDLAGDSGSLADALSETRARWLVLSFSSDWLFPTYQSLELVDALTAVDAEVSFVEIPSPYGHDAFLLEPEAQDALVVPFLDVALAENRAAVASGGAS